MNEVMIRNSTRDEIENDHEDYSLESALFAIKRLIEIASSEVDSVESLSDEIRGCENTIEELERDNDNLKGEVDSLNEKLKEARSLN